MTTLESFLDASIRTATPLLLAGAGELIVERAGIINVGIEGVMLAGAFGGLVGATYGGVAGGVVGAVAGGLLIAAIFGAFALRPQANQIVVGAAVTLLAVGATGALYRALYGTIGAALTIPTFHPLPVPVLHQLPVIGKALFAQPVPTYFAAACIGFLCWWMYRTHGGIALRAVGESPTAARLAGIDVRRVQRASVAVAGALGGLAGGTLVLAQAGTFAEGMSAGRGFIAIAIVVLARWHPAGIALAALLFGAASALQYLLQALGTQLPYHLVLATPYVLTLTALAGVGGRARAPAALGRNNEDLL